MALVDELINRDLARRDLAAVELLQEIRSGQLGELEQELARVG